MDLSNLEKVLESEPKYRLKQIKEAIYKKAILNWNEATFLSLDLRERLIKECPLEIISDILVSKKVYPLTNLDDDFGIATINSKVALHVINGVSKLNEVTGERASSIKARITLKDGLQVESVLMGHKDGRNTICVSSQVGCPLGCLFCATGKMGLKRSLTVDEIIEQVIYFERYLKSKSQKITNVTFMGMGEPFLNYDNVLKAIRILNNKEYFNIGARSISISTAGIIEGIKKFSQEGMQVNLAISLHAPNDKLRSSLMPINKKYPLREVLKAVDEYIKITKRKVMFEYVLIDSVNDSDEQARELVKLMNKKLYFVNLILYNQTGSFRPSNLKRIETFKKILEKNKINFVQRYRFGDDIQAACGQFATNI